MPSLHPPEMQPGRGESRIEEAQEFLRDEGLEEPAPRGRVGQPLWAIDAREVPCEAGVGEIELGGPDEAARPVAKVGTEAVDEKRGLEQREIPGDGGGAQLGVASQLTLTEELSGAQRTEAEEIPELPHRFTPGGPAAPRAASRGCCQRPRWT